MHHETMVVMSYLLDVIKQRRSIRKYKKEPVPQEVVQRIIETAVYAPSAHNAQPWRFVVITDQGQKEALAGAMGRVWLAELERDHIPKNVAQKAVDASVKRFATVPCACVVLSHNGGHGCLPGRGKAKE